MQFQFLQTADIAPEPEGPETTDYGLIQRSAVAAEHLVAADILYRNWDCSFASAGLRYDLIADVGGLRRVQVKMCGRPKLEGGTRLYYIFGAGTATSLSSRSDKRLRNYAGHIDLFAFVASDIRKILYVLPRTIDTQKLMVPASDFSEDRIEISWRTALQEWGLV